MNIYDEALKEVKTIWNGNRLTYPKKTIIALKQAKQLEQDVKRYFELLFKNCELHEIGEYYDLQEKLLKVGKEE